jgi:hypothetical protein
MHTGEEASLGGFIAEKVIEQGGAAAECLFPTIAAFANCVVEVTPQRVERTLGIDNVASKAIGTGRDKVLLSRRGIAERLALLLEEAN